MITLSEVSKLDLPLGPGGRARDATGHMSIYGVTRVSVGSYAL